MTDNTKWLAQRVAEEMGERFLKPMRPGGRMAPVRDLAAELGVCVKTVRMAQKILAQEGLLEIRPGSGVYVARSLASRWVGLYTALDVLKARGAFFHLSALHDLREFFVRSGMKAEVYIGGSEPGPSQQVPTNERFLADVACGRLAGVVITSAPGTPGWAEWVARLPIPAVGAHTPYHAIVDYDAFLMQAVRRLHVQGCRRIALLAWGFGGLHDPLRKALAAYGLAYRPEWVRHDLSPDQAGAGWEELREIWCARPEKPDGLITADDVLFADACIAIQELGIDVPDQLKIVTHANKGAGRRYPFPVTEGLVDPERYAETLGGMLLKRLRGEPVDSSVEVLPIELVGAGPAGRPVGVEEVVIGCR